LPPEESEAFINETRARIAKWFAERPGPPCRGTVECVQQVFEDLQYITISFGTETKISPLEFVDFYRGDRHVGRAEVRECRPGESICVSRSEPPLDVRKGDVAIWEE